MVAAVTRGSSRPMSRTSAKGCAGGFDLAGWRADIDLTNISRHILERVQGVSAVKHQLICKPTKPDTARHYPREQLLIGCCRHSGIVGPYRALSSYKTVQTFPVKAIEVRCKTTGVQNDGAQRLFTVSGFRPTAIRDDR